MAFSVPVAAVGAGMVKVSMDFEKSMVLVETAAKRAGETVQDLSGDLRTLALEAAKDSVFSLDQVSDAMLELARAGLTTAEEMEVSLAPVLDLAAAGELQLENATRATINVLRQFGLEIDQASEVVDALAQAAIVSTADIQDMISAFERVGPVANIFGLTVQDAAVVLSILADQGIRAERAGTGLKVALTRLVSPTKAVQDTLARLGVTVTDADGNFRPFHEIVLSLYDALFGTAKQTVVLNARTSVTAKQVQKAKEVVSAYERDMAILTFRLAAAQSREAKSTSALNSKKAAVLSVQKQIDKLNTRYLDAQRVLAVHRGELEQTTVKVFKLTAAQRAQALGTLFGKRGILVMSAVLGAGRDAWEKYAKEIEAASTAQEQARRVGDTLWGALQRLKNTFTVLSVQAVLPFLEESVIPLIHRFREFVASLEPLPPELTKFAIVTAAVAAAMGPLILLVAQGIKIFGFLLTPLGLLAVALSVLAGMLSVNAFGIRDWVASLSQAEILRKLQLLVEGFQEALKATGSPLKALTISLSGLGPTGRKAAKVLQQLMGTFKAFITALAQGNVQGALGVLGDGFRKLVPLISETLRSILDLWASWSADLTSRIKGAILRTLMAWKAFAPGLEATISGGLERLLDVAEDLLPRLGEIIGQNLRHAAEIFAVLVPTIVEIGGDLIEMISRLWEKHAPRALEILKGFFEGISQGINDAAKIAGDTVSKNWPKIIGLIARVLSGLGSTILKIFQRLSSPVSKAGASLFRKLVAQLPSILAAVLKVISGGIKKFGPKILQALIEVGGQLISGLDVLLKAIIAFWDKNGDRILQGLSDLISRLFDFLVAAIPRVARALAELLLKLAVVLRQNLPGILKVVNEILEGLFAALLKIGFELLKVLIATLKAIAPPLWETLKNVVAAIFENLPGLFRLWINLTALKALRFFLGAFRELGLNLAGEGFSIFRSAIEYISRAWNLLIELPGKILAQGAEVLLELLKDLGSRLAGAARSIFAKIFSNSTQLISQAWTEILQLFSRARGGLSQILRSLLQAVRAFIPRIPSLLQQLLSSSASLLKRLLQTFMSLLGDLVTAIKDIAVKLVQAGKKMISDFISKVIDVLGTLGDKLINILSSSWDKIRDTIPGLLQKAKDLATAFIEKLLEILRGLKEKLVEALTLAWEKIGDTLSILLSNARELGNQFIAKLLEVLQTLGSKLTSLLSGAWDAIRQTLPALVSKARELAGRFITALTEGLRTLGGTLLGILRAAWTKLLELGATLTSVAQSLIREFVNALLSHLDAKWVIFLAAVLTFLANIAEAIPEIVKQGEELASRFVDALVRGISKAIDAVENVIRSILSGVAGFFHAAGEVGKELGRSILEGILNKLSPVLDVIQRILGKLSSVIPGPMREVAQSIQGALESLVGLAETEREKSGEWEKSFQTRVNSVRVWESSSRSAMDSVVQKIGEVTTAVKNVPAQKKVTITVERKALQKDVMLMSPKFMLQAALENLADFASKMKDIVIKIGAEGLGKAVEVAEGLEKIAQALSHILDFQKQVTRAGEIEVDLPGIQTLIDAIGEIVHRFANMLGELRKSLGFGPKDPMFDELMRWLVTYAEQVKKILEPLKEYLDFLKKLSDYKGEVTKTKGRVGELVQALESMVSEIAEAFKGLEEEEILGKALSDAVIAVLQNWTEAVGTVSSAIKDLRDLIEFARWVEDAEALGEIVSETTRLVVSLLDLAADTISDYFKEWTEEDFASRRIQPAITKLLESWGDLLDLVGGSLEDLKELVEFLTWAESVEDLKDKVSSAAGLAVSALEAAVGAIQEPFENLDLEELQARTIRPELQKLLESWKEVLGSVTEGLGDIKDLVEFQGWVEETEEIAQKLYDAAGAAVVALGLAAWSIAIQFSGWKDEDYERNLIRPEIKELVENWAGILSTVTEGLEDIQALVSFADWVEEAGEIANKLYTAAGSAVVALGFAAWSVAIQFRNWSNENYEQNTVRPEISKLIENWAGVLSSVTEGLDSIKALVDFADWASQVENIPERIQTAVSVALDSLVAAVDEIVSEINQWTDEEFASRVIDPAVQEMLAGWDAALGAVSGGFESVVKILEILPEVDTESFQTTLHDKFVNALVVMAEAVNDAVFGPDGIASISDTIFDDLQTAADALTPLASSLKSTLEAITAVVDLSQLGVSENELGQKVDNFQDFFNEGIGRIGPALETAAQKILEISQSTAISQGLQAASDIQEGLNALKEAIRSIHDTIQDIYEIGALGEGEDPAFAAAFEEGITRLQNSLERIASLLSGQEISTTIDLSWLETAVSDLVGYLNQISAEDLKTALEALIDVLSGVIDGTPITIDLSWLSDAIESVTGYVDDIIELDTEAFSTNLGSLASALQSLNDSIPSGLKSKLDDIASSISTLGGINYSTMNSGIRGIRDAIEHLGGVTVTDATDAIRNLIGSTTYNTGLEGLKEAAANAGSKLSLFVGYIGGITTAIRSDEGAQQAIRALVTDIGTLQGAINSFSAQSMVDELNNLKQAAEDASNALQGMPIFPSSPPPLVQGVEASIRALRALKGEMGLLGSMPIQIARVSAVGAATVGQPTEVHYHQNLTIHSSAPTEDIIQDFQILQSLAGT